MLMCPCVLKLSLEGKGFMDKVKVGVVGLGYFGEKHARVYSESMLADLVSVVDVSPKRAREAAKKYNAKSWYTSVYEMLKKEDVDAVSIATPEQHHKEPSVAAAEAGKHIFLEKPIAHTMEDAFTIVDSAKRHKVKLMIGYLLRFDPRYAEGKSSIEGGVIGDVISVWARRAGSIIVPQRVAGWSNPLFYMAVHDIDLINWYVNSDVERVYAEASMKVLADKGVPDVILAVMKFKNGVSASLEVNWCRPATWRYPLESRLHVSGTKGVIYIDIYDQGVNVFSENGHVCPDVIHWPVIHDRLVGDLREEINHFLECIIFDREPLVTGRDGISSLKIALAIMESLEKGEIIKVSHGIIQDLT